MASNKYGYMAKVGVDTSGMQTADREMRALNAEMRAVDNTIRQTGLTSEMAAQRQAILAQQVAATTERLRQLRAAERDIQNGVDSGQISAEQYRAYQREVANTEAALRRLNEHQMAVAETARQTANEADEALKNIEKSSRLTSMVAVSEKMLEIAGKIKDVLLDLSKDALGAYSQYEQLVGGVETLFSGAEDIVLKNADNAFKTAGISANNYLTTVTGFSATLLQGLEGDTKKAAEIADRALIDMADNANKMGTAMASVQYAYQGFAKQNYTMLDNLKLGYGGSASEMARLINDSGVLNGEIVATAKNVKEIPFDKIIEAIHKIQENLGITGTTAKEAETTLEGSMNKLKASWENALVDIARPLDDFAQGSLTLANDNIDRIKGALVSMTEQLKPILDDALGKAQKWIDNGGIEKLSQGFVDTVKFLVDNKDIIFGLIGAATAFTTSSKIEKGITNFAEKLRKSAENAGNLRHILDNFDAASTAEKISAVSSSISLVATAIELTAVATTAFVNSDAFDKFMIFLGYGEIIEESAETSAIGKRTEEIKEMRLELEKLAETDPAAAWRKMTEEGYFEKVYGDVNDITNRIAELKEITESGTVATDGGGYRILSENELQNYRQELSYLKNQIAEKQRLSQTMGKLAHYDESSVAMDEADKAYGDKIRENSAAGRTNADILDELRSPEKIKEKMDEFDHLLAIHQTSEEDYWRRRKNFLEAFRNEESEEWWKYYDEVTDHYDKLAKKEKDARDKADKDLEKEEKEKEKKKKEDTKKLWEAAEREASERIANGEDKGTVEEWLIGKYKEIVDSLEAGTDLYNDYYDKWLTASTKLAEEQAKAWEKASDQSVKAIQKAYDDIEKAQDRAAKTYQLKSSELGKNVTDKYRKEWVTETDEHGKEKKVLKNKERLVLTDLGKEIQKMRKYRESMEKLKSLGAPQELLDGVLQFDFSNGDRQRYLDELLHMTQKQRERYFSDYSKYIEETKKTGAFDTEGTTKERLTQLDDDIKDIFKDVIDGANEKGRLIGEGILNGIHEAMSENDISVLEKLLVPNATEAPQKYSYKSGESVQSGNIRNIDGSNWYRGDTPLVVPVNGQVLYKGTLDYIATQNVMTGGNVINA